MSYLAMSRPQASTPEQLSEEVLGYLQLIPTAALAAIVTGRLDARALAAQTIACRGLDESGKWIGFEASAERMRALVGADFQNDQEAA